MEFRNLIVSFLLVGLVAVAMIAFAFKLQEQNNINSLATSPTIGATYGNLSNALGGGSADAQDQKESFDSDPTSQSFGGIIFTTIISAGRTFGDSVLLIYNIIAGGIGSTLGISSNVLAVFSTILIVSLILLAWSLYRLGR
jgi:hypothetical protein